MNCHIIIPARLASTRLPRKMLLSETGKPLIQHVWEGACASRLAAEVWIATDDEEIFQTVERFGGKCVMTSREITCGTDRIAVVAKDLPEVDLLVNVQGDEPEILGETIDTLIQRMANCPDAVMGTLATPIREKRLLDDPACVKVVLNQNRQALYFSRSCIPYPRGEWRDEWLEAEPPIFYQHVGIYAYRRDFLLKISDLPRTPLERMESLEQLRVLENGYALEVGVIPRAGLGIDTPADYQEFVRRYRLKHSF